MNFLGKNLENFAIFGLRRRSMIFAHLSYFVRHGKDGKDVKGWKGWERMERIEMIKNEKYEKMENKLEINVIMVRKLNYLKNDAGLDGQ